MSMFNGMSISASGMSAQRLRMDLISQNIANVKTTRDSNGETYRRKTLVFAEKEMDDFSETLFKSMTGKNTEFNGSGVKVTTIVEDHTTPMNKAYEPAHPDADEEGYVTYPNVNTVTEMTNMIDATRAYEANITAFNAMKNMMMKTLELGK